jgi:hypothetical protein
MTEVPGPTADELAKDSGGSELDVATRQPVDPNGPVGKALDLLIDGELKLLDIYNARQTSADTRTTALASAAIGLPTLILGLSKSFASNALLLKVGYVAIIVAAFIAVAARSWNAWRRQPGRRLISTEAASAPQLPQRWRKVLRISAEAPDVAKARDQWRDYQHDMAPGNRDPIRVKELALEMWRTRAIDSRRVAEIKDILSVVAASAFGIALIVSAGLVWNARFTP